MYSGRKWLACVIVMVALLAPMSAHAANAWHPPKEVYSAIHRTFGVYTSQALTVSWCESRFHTTARNGQYLGLFQMGSNERRIFGHGSTPLAQARAAYRYFVASGKDWSPWSCQP